MKLDGPLPIRIANNMSTCEVSSNGTKRWTLDGQLHRLDGPAVEYPNGDKYWFYHGQFHRESNPAIECANGHKAWYLYGQRHREDGPAIEYYNGTKVWYYHGKYIDCSSQEEFKTLINK